MELENKYQSKTLIYGPCSAESFEQLDSLLAFFQIHQMFPDFFRAGVWKPRSRPGNFEGHGEEALEWLSEIQDKYQVPAIVEVASVEHLRLIDKYQIRNFWIGARTSANPFMVQQIADAIQGAEFNIFVKNSIHPDLHLWIGNVERLSKSTKGKVGAIHRGFSVYDSAEKYRNRPNWAIPLEFKRLMPDHELICDPSHIAGKSDYIFDLGQKAWNMDFDGLMIETHPHPSMALSDADQQITPEVLENYLQNWQLYSLYNIALDKHSELDYLRENIDAIDSEIIDLLAKRNEFCEKIGEVKNHLQIPAYIAERWNHIIQTRTAQATSLGITSEYILEIYKQIHQMSIQTQLKTLKINDNKTY